MAASGNTPTASMDTRPDNTNFALPSPRETKHTTSGNTIKSVAFPGKNSQRVKPSDEDTPIIDPIRFYPTIVPEEAQPQDELRHYSYAVQTQSRSKELGGNPPPNERAALSAAMAFRRAMILQKSVHGNRFNIFPVLYWTEEEAWLYIQTLREEDSDYISPEAFWGGGRGW